MNPSLSDLAVHAQWVAWRNEMRDGRMTKVPYVTRDRKAEADEPTGWLRHASAVAIAEIIVNGSGGGIGIELGRCGDLWLAGVDLDTCRDASTGNLEPWALAVVQRFLTYTEISPSGTGVKLFFLISPDDIDALRAAMGTQHGRQFKRANGAAHPPAIELHISHRYFAVTWEAYDDAPNELREMPLEELRWLVEEAGPAFLGKGGSDILGRLKREAARNKAVATALASAATMKGGSRSEGAYGVGLGLKRAGWTFADMQAALLACPATREWATEADERQFLRVWQGDALEDAPGRPVEPPPAILTGAQFVARHVPPVWLIDGLVQRGRLYACTSLTGHGKTAVWLFNACMIHAGWMIGPRAVHQGNVLILAGENPSDMEARMIGLASAFSLPASRLPYVLPGGFPLTAEAAELLRASIAALAVPLALIVGDTASSFFPGDDENSNVQAGGYARTLRTFTAGPGNPAVVVLSHPTKGAMRGNLLPRGGGAFLNELDGNLDLWSDSPGEITELHWCGKIRGPDFSPFGYWLRSVPTGMIDEHGRPEMTVLAEPMSDEAVADYAKQSLAAEDVVLLLLRDQPELSFAQIAKDRGWVGGDGAPEKWRVQRIIRRLASDKLVQQLRKGAPWELTDKGQAALKEAGK